MFNILLQGEWFFVSFFSGRLLFLTDQSSSDIVFWLLSQVNGIKTGFPCTPHPWGTSCSASPGWLPENQGSLSSCCWLWQFCSHILSRKFINLVTRINLQFMVKLLGSVLLEVFCQGLRLSFGEIKRARPKLSRHFIGIPDSVPQTKSLLAGPRGP